MVRVGFESTAIFAIPGIISPETRFLFVSTANNLISIRWVAVFEAWAGLAQSV